MTVGSSCPRLGEGIGQILLLHQPERLVELTLFCCCPNCLMLLAYLKDLSVTLIRAAVNAKQCFLSIQRPLPTPATIYCEKKHLYLQQQPFARPQQLMSVNYLSPESNTFSLCQNSWAWRIKIPTHTHVHTVQTDTHIKLRCKCTHTDAHKQTHQQMPSLAFGQCRKSDTPSICSCYSQQPKLCCYGKDLPT